MKSKLSFRILSLILCVLTVFSMCFFSVFSASASNNIVVTTDAVRLRSTPEISDSNFITTLGVAEALTLLSNSENGWANVRRENGAEGYCSVDYLDIVSGSSVTFKGITTDEVNFRKGPSTDYDSIKVLSEGQELSVTDNSQEYWVKAKVDGVEGYVYRSYVSLNLFVGAGESEVPSEPTAKPTEPQPTEAPVTEATEPVTEPSDDVVTEVITPQTPRWYSDSLLEDDSTYLNAPVIGEFVLTHDNISIHTGDTVNLSAFTLGYCLDNLSTFRSSDSSVASVSDNGVVLGLTQGEADISVSFNGKKQVCKVIVSGEPYTPEVTTPTNPQATVPAATVPATQPPTEPKTFELSASSVTMEKGNLYVLTSPIKDSEWSSSNKNVATVNEWGLVKALQEGEAVITASAQDKTGTCKITVTKASSGLTIEYSDIEVSKGKTFYNEAYSSSYITWTSSDEKIATVTNGFITAVGEGVAVVEASSSQGTKTCLVTVSKAEPVRFTYAYPNTVAKGETLNLVAVTDNTRTAVQFKIDVNGTVKTIDATSKKADGDKVIWTASTVLDTAGTFKATAYSKLGSGYFSCDDSKTTVFVRENKDLVKETKEYRRASDELISLLASFEGYVGNVYFDNLAGGIPTLGYGKVVYVGDTFYNDMTKTEALAMLYDTVNNGGYASNVNTYLESLDANYNQQQFDALVSFAYNIGYYGLRSDSEIRALILEAKEKKTVEKPEENSAYVNGTQVNFRKGAGTEFESLGWLSYPDSLTLLDTKLQNNVWYHVKTADGREGYIHKDYVTLGVPAVEGEIYLSLINKAEFTRVILEYHHASSTCIYGLLYRRVDELDLFYYGDYERDGDENRFGYSYACYKNNSFGI